MCFGSDPTSVQTGSASCPILISNLSLVVPVTVAVKWQRNASPVLVLSCKTGGLPSRYLRIDRSLNQRVALGCIRAYRHQQASQYRNILTTVGAWTVVRKPSRGPSWPGAPRSWKAAAIACYPAARREATRPSPAPLLDQYLCLWARSIATGLKWLCIRGRCRFCSGQSTGKNVP